MLVVIFLTGCSTIAVGNTAKPSGEEIFDILFANLHLPIDNEPLCNMKSTTREHESITLGQHLATIFSVSYASDSIITIKSSCGRSKHESKNKEVIDIWDCDIEVLENNRDGEFISSAMIAFSTPLDKTELLPGSLRCL